MQGNKKDEVNDNQILLTLNDNTLKEIDEITKQSFMSRQELIRTAIREYLERKKKNSLWYPDIT